MEIKFRKSTATILSMSDILFPAQLYIPICTVTESSCDLVCCRESLTKGRQELTDGFAMGMLPICHTASRVYLNFVGKSSGSEQTLEIRHQK